MLFDLIILIIIGVFVLAGLWFGVIQTLGSTVGIILGAAVAGNYYEAVANYGGFILGQTNTAKVIAFVIILIVVNRLVGFVFYLIDRTFGVVTRLPFLGGISRLAGAIIGFIEGVMTVGLSLYVMSKYPISGWVTSQMSQSQFTPWLLVVAGILVPLLPEMLRKLQSTIQPIIEEKIKL